MARVNLTLDLDTFGRLARVARQSHAPCAAVARALLLEALEQRERAERERKLAADYAAGREDARALLEELEAQQLEILDEESD
ncbi:MAG: hypothetical protein A2138_04690 [Deltaproteobacteria bacterium RBG_16_71_12]|nr:MAG: hypothetical protein A2138_04690 [Deltaproteobacteria bacterium RBG_16_71_12]